LGLSSSFPAKKPLAKDHWKQNLSYDIYRYIGLIIWVAIL